MGHPPAPAVPHQAAPSVPPGAPLPPVEVVPVPPAEAAPEPERLAKAVPPSVRGEASWYGAALHRRRTASGERFDMHALTAAHRTLPLGTRVCVRSLLNGRAVVVRINDRGPRAAHRVIDLSRAAAQALGMLGRGTKPVELTVLEAPDASCPEP